MLLTVIENNYSKLVKGTYMLPINGYKKEDWRDDKPAKPPIESGNEAHHLMDVLRESFHTYAQRGEMTRQLCCSVCNLLSTNRIH